MNTADKPPEDVAQELEVPERLPEEIETDILRKYFTLTASDLGKWNSVVVRSTGWDLPSSSAHFAGVDTSWATRDRSRSQCWRQLPHNWACYQCRSRGIHRTRRRGSNIWSAYGRI